MTPRIAFRSDWKIARMEVKTAVIAPKMEERSEPMESIREGILLGFFALGGFAVVLLVVVWC